MRSTQSPRAPLLAFLAFLLALPAITLVADRVPRAAAGDEEDDLAPTPAASPEDVARTMSRHGIPEVALSEEARTPVSRRLVGAVTGHPGGRLGFMPLLQHHMAVEHWFVERLTREALGRPVRAGERLFVCLEGTVRLERQWSPFGGGTGFYGDGLAHGRVYGGPSAGVMGYHESVYRLAVEQIVWIRSREEFAALRAEHQREQAAFEGAVRSSRWSDARAAYGRARALEADVGVASHEDFGPFLDAALLFTGDPDAWTDDDVAAIAAAFGGPFPSFLQETAYASFAAAAARWPPGVRERLGPPLVRAWEGLEYRFQRDALRNAVLKALGGEAVQGLEARIADAERRLQEVKATFKEHVAAYRYGEAWKAWEQIRPIQAFLLTAEFSDQQVQHWMPSLERCVALEDAFDDPARRLALLEEQVPAAIAAGLDLPNNRYRPRYPKELDEHFFPRLTEPERRRIEALVIEVARRLDPEEDWDDSLVASEILAGVGGRAAAAFLPDFLARRRSRPPWQVDFHRAFHDRVRERASR